MDPAGVPNPPLRSGLTHAGVAFNFPDRFLVRPNQVTTFLSALLPQQVRTHVTNDGTHVSVTNNRPSRRPIPFSSLNNIIVMATSIFNILLLSYCLSMSTSRTAAFAILTANFAFWRLSYNFLLGLLLKWQSESSYVQLWIQKHILSSTRLRAYFDLELQQTYGKEFDFSTLPNEFICWHIFGFFIDIILSNDFSSHIAISIYAYFAPANSSIQESGKSFFLASIARHIGGLFLIFLALWVKIDAHRVIKDYAWYWGDFFFRLTDSALNFDGVFELAPHPMYSLGYFWYYGLWLISDSYTVLYVSVAAHLAQFLFLIFVEIPHIDRIYGPDDDMSRLVHSGNPLFKQILRKYFSTDLLTMNFKNFDPYHANDLLFLLFMAYAAAVAAFAPPAAVALQAAFWIVTHIYGSGMVLYLQSHYKTWTRHFISRGQTNQRAFESWKIIFNVSLGMMYMSYTLAAIRFFELPANFQSVVLRILVSLVFFLLHAWNALSVRRVLGEFGFYYGDFFIDEISAPIYYTGVYRYLNNPEIILGNAALLGIATLAGGSKTLYLLAAFCYLSAYLLIRFVEQPHMSAKYGAAIREESGVQRALRKMGNCVQPVSEQMSSLTKGISAEKNQEAATKVTSESKNRKNVSINNSNSDVESDFSNYTLRLVAPVSNSTKSILQRGETLEYEVHLPDEHSSLDWVGLYASNSNAKLILPGSETLQSSKGHWRYVTSNSQIASRENPKSQNSTYRVSFDTSELAIGYYDAVLHLNDSHSIAAVSGSRVQILVPLDFSNVIIFDSADRPGDSAESQSNWITKNANQIASAINQAYGIDYSPSVVAKFSTIEELRKAAFDTLAELNIFFR